MVKLQSIYKKSIICILAIAFLTFAMPCFMLHSEYMPEINISELVLNLLCIFIVFGAAFLLTGRIKAAVISGSFLLVLLSTVNAFVYSFRGKELSPMDFLSVGTAINVAGQYRFVPDMWMISGWIMWLLSVIILCKLPAIPKPPPLKSRIYSAAAMLLSVLIIIVGAKDKPIKTWETEGTRLNGFYLNFCIALRDSKVKVPDGYSPNQVEEYAQQYTVNNTYTAKPNVLVIMDESYVDFASKKPKTNIPVTPFLDSLKDNTIRGNALTSVYGGNTANAEFEFLTGHSMAFLPDNTVPYQQYINDDIYSLAWLMQSYGYRCVATHPYYSDGWSRTRAYPKLGFSEYSFIESYPSQNIMRNYISDREMFEYIIDYTAKTDEPLFMFGITMQNHGGYDYDGESFSNIIELEGFDGEYPLAEQYLSLIYETDKAMEYLITSLQKSEKDTVVLFFGDHFPKLESGFYDELYGESRDSLEEQMSDYTVPFIIWANYDIDEKTVDCTSLNYLSTYLLESAGLELPPYNQFLKDAESVIPAINALGYYSVSKSGFTKISNSEGEEAEYMKKYSNLQYNNLFDKENISESFFKKYMMN